MERLQEMNNTEEIIENQTRQIAALQKEIIGLKSSEDNSYYTSIISGLQEELLQMHSKIGELYYENDNLKAINKSLQSKYDCIINSKSWKKTQFLRNMVWKMKGNK